MTPVRFEVVLDRTMRTIEVSQDYLTHFAAARNDLLGVSIHAHPIIPAGERDRVAAAIERCLREKIPVININHGRPLSGGELYLTRWINTPRRDGRGRVFEVHCLGEVFRDRRRAAKDRRSSP